MAHPALVASSLTVVAVALALPYGDWLGFVPLSPALLAVLAATTVGYLLSLETVKWAFRARITKS